MGPEAPWMTSKNIVWLEIDIKDVIFYKHQDDNIFDLFWLIRVNLSILMSSYKTIITSWKPNQNKLWSLIFNKFNIKY